MENRSFWKWDFPCILLAVVLLFPFTVLAYIDPGTGGLLYQIGFALFTAIASLLWVPLRTIKKLFSKFRRSSKNTF